MGYGRSVRCGQIRLGAPVSSGAFAPINPAWLADAVSFVAHTGAAPVPHFWNPNPFQDFIAASQADVQHPVRLTLALIAPLALCWMVIRAPLPAFGFAIFYVGVLLFSNIWNFGSRDAQVSTVAGYLGRHMYFLECECPGTYVVYNSQKQWLLSPPERARRLLRAMDSPERSDAIVILNVPFRQEETSLVTPTLSILFLKEFVGAETDESYWIYQVKKKSS